MRPKETFTLLRVIKLFPKAPFHFDATMHKPDHFPSADNAWQPGIRWQTMRWQDVPLGLKFESQGTIERPQIALSVWAQEKLGRDFLDSLTQVGQKVRKWEWCWQ